MVIAIFVVVLMGSPNWNPKAGGLRSSKALRIPKAVGSIQTPLLPPSKPVLASRRGAPPPGTCRLLGADSHPLPPGLPKTAVCTSGIRCRLKKPVRDLGRLLKALGPTEGHGVMYLARNNTNHRKIKSPAVKSQNI